MGALLAFIPGVLANWKLIVAALCAIGMGLFAWSWHARGIEIIEQQQTIATLQANLIVAQKEKTIMTIGEGITDDRAKDRSVRDTTITTITEGARNAPPSSDAPLAPVMLDMLDALARLRTGKPAP